MWKDCMRNWDLFIVIHVSRKAVLKSLISNWSLILNLFCILRSKKIQQSHQKKRGSRSYQAWIEYNKCQPCRTYSWLGWKEFAVDWYELWQTKYYDLGYVWRSYSKTNIKDAAKTTEHRSWCHTRVCQIIHRKKICVASKSAYLLILHLFN